MAKKRMPPKTITTGGEKQTLTLMRIVQRDELGRAILLRVCREKEVFALSEEKQANHFFFAYVGEGLLG